MIRRKSITLCFRGGNTDPQSVESLIGVKSSDFGVKGQPVKPGIKTLLKRSFIQYSMSFHDEKNLDEVVEALFSQLGGIEQLANVRERMRPEFIDLVFVLHLTDAEEQKSAFLTPETLETLAKLRVTLSFQFV